MSTTNPQQMSRQQLLIWLQNVPGRFAGHFIEQGIKQHRRLGNQGTALFRGLEQQRALLLAEIGRRRT